ncbi:MAG: putative CULlin protein 1 [Streblomastix strix]|uniref:Putative CULlin protein 1 n=1 Tax=Streblomastix strix TaxID=222440 RepID=A0A5J4VQ76_9EUKA|nr:MAG: putative CULlin protein 1 [Streblomastix strix]
MAISHSELNLIENVNDAWTRYLKPAIDDIKQRIEGEVKDQKFSINHLMRFTNIVGHLIQELNFTNEVAELALNIFVDNCENDINTILNPLKDGPFLLELARSWQKYKIFTKIICLLFKYLDNVYFKFEHPTGKDGEMRVQTLQQRAYDIFRDRVFVNRIDQIQNLVLHFIDRDRIGEQVDNTMMKNAVELFIALDPSLVQFYESLENQFLNRAKVYYHQFAHRTIETDTVPEYMIKCEAAFGKENQRVANYMNPITHQKIRKVLDDELLENQTQILFNWQQSGFLALVEEDKIDDLGRMYRLMTHLDNALGINLMAQDFQTHIQSVGQNLMNQIDELEEKKTGQAEDIDQDPNIEIIKEKKAPAKKKQEKKSSGIEKDDKGEELEQKQEQEQVVGAKKKKKKKKTALIRDDEVDEAPIGTEVKIVEAGEGEAVVEAKAGGLQNEIEKLSQVSTFVEQILNLYRRYNRMYVESFQKYTKFNDCIEAAFSDFLNRPTDEFSDQKFVIGRVLAIYVNELMKSQAATALDDQIKTRFHEIATILKFIRDKDTFELSNQYLLSCRILDEGVGTMVQRAAEEAFIFELKETFGVVFTFKLKAMFEDHEKQTEAQIKIDKYLINQSKTLGYKLQVQILTKSNWPKFQNIKINLPDYLRQGLSEFEQFYKETSKIDNVERSLEWIHSQGSMKVQVQFSENKCNFIMQVIQALVLLFFANGATQTIGGIASQLGIEKTEARRNIDSLMGKIPLLVKVNSGSEEDGNELKDDDELMLNKQLHPKKKSFKIPGIPLLNEEVTGKQNQLLIKDRKVQIDSQQLVNSTIVQITSFHPSSNNVRQQIESLISRGYLKRNDANMQLIDYVA